MILTQAIMKEFLILKILFVMIPWSSNMMKLKVKFKII